MLPPHHRPHVFLIGPGPLTSVLLCLACRPLQSPLGQFDPVWNDTTPNVADTVYSHTIVSFPAWRSVDCGLLASGAASPFILLSYL